jgi:hypothetical protein
MEILGAGNFQHASAPTLRHFLPLSVYGLKPASGSMRIRSFRD